MSPGAPYSTCGCSATFCKSYRRVVPPSLELDSETNAAPFPQGAVCAIPFEGGLTPFGFVGGGAVTMDQADGSTVPTFTKPAAMLGLGFGYLIPRSRVELFAEGKSLVYKWDRTGFDKTLWDVTYSVGLAYRIPLQ